MINPKPNQSQALAAHPMLAVAPGSGYASNASIGRNSVGLDHPCLEPTNHGTSGLARRQGNAMRLLGPLSGHGLVARVLVLGDSTRFGLAGRLHLDLHRPALVDELYLPSVLGHVWLPNY